MLTEKITYAAIYVRVSSKKQVTDGNGLSSQISTCYEHCKSCNYEVVETFQDDSTGGNDDREGLRKLKRWLLQNRTKNVVIVFDSLSRLSRDVKVYHEIRELILAAGARFSCPTFNFNDSPESELSENIQVSVDSYHRKSNAAQTKRRTKARVKDGYWCFTAPFGYRADGKGKVMVPHETLAPIAKFALEGYASGHFQTQNEVRQYIEAQPEYQKSRKTKGTGGSFVSNMLRREIYAGYYEYKKWEIGYTEGKYEPLISMSTFKKIQMRLAEKPIASARKDVALDFPLRGFVTCADCNGSLTAAWSQGNQKKYAYYECHEKGCISSRKSIPRDKIEGEFEEQLAKLQPSEDVVAVTKEILKDMWQQQKMLKVERKKSF
ncbi:MAG: recombinase family protein [Aliishimia sp.]